MTPEKLMELAKEAMTHAYVPYSGYKVGAALLCADGTVYQGCNMENAAYSPTVCAERTAFFKAVYDGHRDFTAIAVCGGKDGILSGMFPPLWRVPAGDGRVLQGGLPYLYGGRSGKNPKLHPGRAAALWFFCRKIHGYVKTS